jgi:CheY-like chemotaxis protein
MTAMVDLIRKYRDYMYPLNQLSEAGLADLAPWVGLRRIAARSILYSVGETPKDYLYLLRGSIWLFGSNEVVPRRTVRPVLEEPSQPLPYVVPTADKAEVAEDSLFVYVDRAALAAVLSGRKATPAAAGSAPESRPAERAAEIKLPEDLPVAPAQAPAPVAEPAAAAEAQPTADHAADNRARILVVEDQAADAKVCEILLKALGFRFDWARDSDAALELLKFQHYDAVLLDVQMPGVDGFEATRLIRAAIPGSACPKIVAVTSRSLKGDREACLAAGMDDYIPKPISKSLLAAKLSKMQRDLIDPKFMKQFSEQVGRQAVVEFLDILIATLPETIEQLRHAVNQDRPRDLHVTAHSLKSTMEFVGGDVIAQLVRKLEHLGRSGTTEGARELLTQIEGLRQRTEAELRKLRDEYQ